MKSLKSSRIHILAQHVWPDDAATGLYAEQVAQTLVARGLPVVLVGGVGRYRESARPRPDANIIRLDHFCGKRGNLLTVAWEYHSLSLAFREYIQQYVNSGDVVVIGSFPPNTVRLASQIQNRGAISVYWLQDYYPEILRGLWEYPAVARRSLSASWNYYLQRWDYVVKSSGNLAYNGPNARVIRNWPSVDLGPEMPFIPKTALYSGGLGYAHSLKHLLVACEELKNEGYEVIIRGDGPGFKKLPRWIHREPPLQNLQMLTRSYWEAEVHLVAAHPRIQRALFPSKFWNSLATGRRLICTGFEGEMETELEISKQSAYQTHRQAWADFIASLL